MSNLKRILLSIVTLVMALSVGALATRSAWTDTVTVTNNQIVTGTVDLLVSTNNFPGGSGAFNTATAGSTMSISGLFPGDTLTAGTYSFSLRNNSGGLVDFSLTGQVVGADTLITPNPGVDKSQLMVEIFDMANGVEVAELPLTTWEAGPRSFTQTLTNLATRDYGIRARLLNTALDEWQGQTVTFTLSIVGTQLP